MAFMSEPTSPDLEMIQAEDPEDTASTGEVPPEVDPEIQHELEESQAEADKEEEDLNQAILDLVEMAEKEDEDIRINLLNVGKRNTLYFNNIQNIFLDPVAKDYRSVDAVMEELQRQGMVTDIKVSNVYRPWVESIVAALSVEVPSVEFAPEDCDNPEDIEAAKAFENIGKLVSRKNSAALKLIKALVIMMNQGVVFGHICYEESEKYGTVRVANKWQEVPTQVNDLRCANCGQILDVGVSEVPGEPIECPDCGATAPPETYPRMELFDQEVGYEDQPKGMTRFDVYGPNHVKVPLYARDQEKCGYVILRIDDHIARFRAEYGDQLEEGEDFDSSRSDLNKYERWARSPIEYVGDFMQDLTTIRYCYFRPWYYHTLDNKERVEMLKQRYPKGLKVAVIDDYIVSRESKNLDEDWEISYDPRADYIHAEPAGNSIIPIQDGENDVFNVGIQSIIYGIGETFVHPKTLNLKNYSESRGAPGMMTNALPPSADKSLADGFHTIKAATLTGEYSAFSASLQSRGQLVSGAMPSLFGGQNLAGSKTASEYKDSRAQALQRIQIPWRTIKVFWTGLIFKSSVCYANNLQEDEHFQEKKNGSFINVWISKSSLTGKVGRVEPDLNETIPHTWAQKRDSITNLIGLQIPEVGQILMHPNNSELLRQYAAIPELYIPGENDRNKQWAEFYQILRGEEATVDVQIDDHGVHMQVMKNILVSPQGMSLDPEIRQVCINHYIEHEQAQMAKTQAPSGMTGEGEPAESATQTTQG